MPLFYRVSMSWLTIIFYLVSLKSLVSFLKAHKTKSTFHRYHQSNHHWRVFKQWKKSQKNNLNMKMKWLHNFNKCIHGIKIQIRKILGRLSKFYCRKKQAAYHHQRNWYKKLQWWVNHHLTLKTQQSNKFHQQKSFNRRFKINWWLLMSNKKS